MTEKPYTDADVDLVAATFTAEAKKNPIDTSAPPWMPQTRLLLGPTEHDIARAVLDALAAAGRLARTGPDWSHEIAFADDGVWSIGHPDGCPGQLDGDCTVVRAAHYDVTAPVAWSLAGGRYQCAVSEAERFLLGDRVGQDVTA